MIIRASFKSTELVEKRYYLQGIFTRGQGGYARYQFLRVVLREAAGNGYSRAGAVSLCP